MWPPTATGSDGRFQIGDLPEGRFRIRIRAGAAKRELTVDVRPGETQRLTFEPFDPRPGEAAGVPQRTTGSGTPDGDG